MAQPAEEGKYLAPYGFGVALTFLRIILGCFLFLLLIGLILEVSFRIKGMRPKDLFQQGQSATVPDSYTAWRMKPGVHGASEASWTNSLGIHSDHEVDLSPRPGKPRIGILGSSVVWGLGEPLVNTIPAAAQEALLSSGHPAEVLNLANHGFNLINIAALVQNYSVQLKPAALVIVMDMQISFPKWPGFAPYSGDDSAVHHLSTWEYWSMRAASKSVVAGLLWGSEEWTRGFRERLAFNQKKADPEVVRPAAVLATPEKVALYEVGRRKEIRSLLASISGFCREQGIALFVTTPYGPYFSFTDAEMKNFPHHLYAGSVPYYGSERAAIEREARLSIETVRKASIDFGFELIDLMSDLGRNGGGFSDDFSADGIHLTSKGNRRVGYRIAQELASRFRPLGGKPRL